MGWRGAAARACGAGRGPQAAARGVAVPAGGTQVLHDEGGRVWIMLHSGSRNIGNVTAQYYDGKAKVPPFPTAAAPPPPPPKYTHTHTHTHILPPHCACCLGSTQRV